EVVKSAISECYRQKPECIIKDGIMQKGVIIRHLVLPQNTKTAIEVFDWVREKTPNAYFSLMSQYLPFGKALDHKVLGRKITRREYEKVVDYICEFNFPNVFIQERESSSEKFIPLFDLKGV
ncbi:MAG: radical SAM protein, partial [Clostridia bacterium]|nr:radical SAM protein [Clostridia bacterium]